MSTKLMQSGLCRTQTYSVMSDKLDSELNLLKATVSLTSIDTVVSVVNDLQKNQGNEIEFMQEQEDSTHPARKTSEDNLLEIEDTEELIKSMKNSQSTSNLRRHHHHRASSFDLRNVDLKKSTASFWNSCSNLHLQAQLHSQTSSSAPTQSLWPCGEETVGEFPSTIC
eukprot:Awhi_evm2s5673